MIASAKPVFIVTKSTLEHMRPLHRLAAMAAIADGRWQLIDDHQGVLEVHR